MTLEQQLSELERQTQRLAKLSEIECHLAQHGLRLARRGERTSYCWLKMPGWTKRRLVWVCSLYRPAVRG